MAGCVLRAACKLVMKNHFYTYNNEIRKQGKGEKLGRFIMKRHDKKYLKLLKTLKVEHEIFERYVDDETEGLAAINPGVRFVDNKLVKDETLVELDKNIPENERTFNLPV